MENEILEEKPLIKPQKSSKNLIVIILVGATQGLLGLADLSMAYLYKDDFGMGPAEVSLAVSLTQIPWIIKPVWGFISDCFPILGRRRAPYMSIFGTIAISCWICMAYLVESALVAILVVTLIQISNAFCNVLGEAMVVQESQKSEDESKASRFVSLFFGIKAVGCILTAYSGGLLLEIFEKKTVFLITACCQLLLVIAGVLIDEKQSEVLTVSSQFKDIWQFVKQPMIWMPIVFILLFMATPSSMDALFYFQVNQLGFSPEFMGRIRMVWGIGTLIGIFLYNTFLKEVSFKKMMVSSSFICAGLGMLGILLITRTNKYIGIPDQIFAISSAFINQAVGQINIMPILVLACQICPKNIEASMYALLMSTVNLGSLLASQTGGLLMLLLGITQTNFELLWLLVLLCNLIMLLPLPFLVLVPEFQRPTDKEEVQQNQVL